MANLFSPALFILSIFIFLKPNQVEAAKKEIIKLVADKNVELTNNCLRAKLMTNTNDIVWADKFFAIYPENILFYYEVEYSKSRRGSRIAVGLSDHGNKFSLFYSNGGKIIQNGGIVHSSKKYGEENIIGCGLFKRNDGKRFIFFTHFYKNFFTQQAELIDKLIPLPLNVDENKLYAAIQIAGKGTEILANFDEAKMEIRKSKLKEMFQKMMSNMEIRSLYDKIVQKIEKGN